METVIYPEASPTTAGTGIEQSPTEVHQCHYSWCWVVISSPADIIFSKAKPSRTSLNPTTNKKSLVMNSTITGRGSNTSHTNCTTPCQTKLNQKSPGTDSRDLWKTKNSMWPTKSDTPKWTLLPALTFIISGPSVTNNQDQMAVVWAYKHVQCASPQHYKFGPPLWASGPIHPPNSIKQLRIPFRATLIFFTV